MINIIKAFLLSVTVIAFIATIVLSMILYTATIFWLLSWAILGGSIWAVIGLIVLLVVIPAIKMTIMIINEKDY